MPSSVRIYTMFRDSSSFFPAAARRSVHETNVLSIVVTLELFELYYYLELYELFK